jgi:hypothetical protein
MNVKSLLLPLFMSGSLCGIYFLPSEGEMADSAVTMELPDHLGKWQLQKTPPSKDEIKTLAPDTKFSKALCLAARPGEMDLDGYAIADRVDLSIVLSGADPNNSIHRPERCMPAQGHHDMISSSQSLKLQNGREFPVKRLYSIQTLPANEKRKESLSFHCVTYYFFVGHDRLSNDHWGRTFIDMKDRLVRGMDQHWAYISASMWYGDLTQLGIEKDVPEAEADSKLRKFLTDFSEKQISWDQITH